MRMLRKKFPRSVLAKTERFLGFTSCHEKSSQDGTKKVAKNRKRSHKDHRNKELFGQEKYRENNQVQKSFTSSGKNDTFGMVFASNKR